LAFELVHVNKEIDIIGFNAIHYFELDKYFFHPPETHECWEMLYVDLGSVITITDGIGSELYQGQVIFHKPMEQHSHISNRKDPSNVLVISFTSHSEIMSYFNNKIFSLKDDAKGILSLFMNEAVNALGELPQQFEDKSPLNFDNAKLGSTQMMQIYLTEFLFTLLRSEDAPYRQVYGSIDSRKIAKDATVETIEKFLINNVYNKLTLQDICDVFLISKSYLCKIFKEQIGESPIDYLTGLKMKEAKRLTRSNQYNVTQISNLLAYSSIQHFSRMFKKVVGSSPSEYENSVKSIWES
jgi:AraC-like DNA-binding protein